MLTNLQLTPVRVLSLNGTDTPFSYTPSFTSVGWEYESLMCASMGFSSSDDLPVSVHTLAIKQSAQEKMYVTPFLISTLSVFRIYKSLFEKLRHKYSNIKFTGSKPHLCQWSSTQYLQLLCNAINLPYLDLLA